MERLSVGQLKILADFLKVISATWFSAGIITPLFTKPETFLQTAKIPVLGIAMSFVFLWLAVFLMKGIKS
jgi:hypothetical protein